MRKSLIKNLQNSSASEDPFFGLGETRFKRLYLEYLAERPISESSLDEDLDEGFGTWLKHKLGKLGSFEKGGKFFGRGKAMKGAAADYSTLKSTPEIQKAEETLNAIGGDQAKEFPNNKDNQAFVDMATGAVGAALGVAQKEYKGNPEAFEQAVGNIRAWIKYMSDYKLADVYKHFEAKLSDMPLVLEMELLEAELSQLSREKGDTESVKGLKSSLLPKILAAVGALGGIAALVAHSFPDQVWHAVTDPSQVENLSHSVDSAFTFDRGDGMIRGIEKFMRNTRVDGVSTPLDPNNSGDIHQFFKIFGGGDESAGIARFAARTTDPTHAKEWLMDRLNSGVSVDKWGMESTWHGFDVSGTSPKSILFIKNAFPGTPATISQIVRTARLIPGVTHMVATGSMFAGPVAIVAGSIAAAGLASAAAIKAIRAKGLKSSRAKTLNDLLATLNDIKPEEGGDEGGGEGGKGEGGFRGGTIEKLTDREFLKSMTDLLVRAAGPANPVKGKGGVKTIPWDPAKANKIANETKAGLDDLKKKGLVTRTTVEMLVDKKVGAADSMRAPLNLMISAQGGTPLSGENRTQAINLCMAYAGAPEERGSLRGGDTRKDPMREKALTGPEGNRLIGDIIAEMAVLTGKDGKPKYPTMRTNRADFEDLIKSILSGLVKVNALLKEARIFVGNSKNSQYFKSSVEVARKHKIFTAKGANTAMAVPFVEDLFRILIKKSRLAESNKKEGELVLERWNKIAGLNVL